MPFIKRSEILSGLVFFGVIYIAYLLYYPGLYGPLILDDLSQLSPIIELHSEDTRTLISHFLFSSSGALGRPVSMSTFIANAITAGDEIFYWKLTNLIIHLLNAAMLFWLTITLLQTQKRFREYSYPYALLITTLWLLHPLQVSTVLYTVQRMTELATLFTFAGLLLYCKGRLRQTEKNRSGSIHICVAIFLMLPLAMLSKESGILLLPLIIVMEIFIFRFKFPATLDGKITRVLTYLNIAVILLGIIITIVIFNSYFMPMYLYREFTLTERIYTEFRILVFYLFSILAPMKENMGFYHDDILISKSLIDPISTLGSLVLILSLATWAWKTRHRAPLFGLGIFFFFTAHSLESTVLPLELVFEHRNYLASAGVFLALLGLKDLLPVSTGKYLISGIVLMTLLSSLVTLMRIETWASRTMFDFYTYIAHPESPRASVIRANNLALAGQYKQANQLLSKFNGPGYTLNKLYIQCLEKKSINDEQLVMAGNELHQWLRIYELSGLMKLANLGLDNKCSFSNEQFLKLLETALDQNFSHNAQKQKIMIYKAHYLHKKQNHEAAIKTAVDAYEVNRLNPMPLAMAIEWLSESGQTGLASDYIQNIKTLSDDHGGIYDRLIKELEEKTGAQ